MHFPLRRQRRLLPSKDPVPLRTRGRFYSHHADAHPSDPFSPGDIDATFRTVHRFFSRRNANRPWPPGQEHPSPRNQPTRRRHPPPRLLERTRPRLGSRHKFVPGRVPPAPPPTSAPPCIPTCHVHPEFLPATHCRMFARQSQPQI